MDNLTDLLAGLQRLERELSLLICVLFRLLISDITGHKYSCVPCEQMAGCMKSLGIRGLYMLNSGIASS
jgi:hypothetical protein